MSLKVSAQIAEKVKNGEISAAEAERFSNFVETCNQELMTHSVITDNKFCEWFAKGEADRDTIRHFITQFSVFSNLFLVAQTMKVINAGSLEGMRASKEILANELGVIFNNKGAATEEVTDKDREGDPAVVSIEGTVDGGTFRFKAAHFEWLLKLGSTVDLTFKDMGKRRNGTPATIFFCDQLMSIYGHEDPNLAEGASFAVENWAAAGFWKQLIAGLEIFKEKEQPDLPLAFFTWHDRIEDQHAGHVMDELEELYFEDDFDEEKFIAGGLDMLSGVEAFWVGLNEHRIAAAYV
ncbi:MAG: hypothetical protein ACI9UK_000118 [Candidatus Krumholzibacteriia bacterium]|jgi:hypothetical protein